MSIIYTTKDRIPVNIGDITFQISPLSYQQKTTLQALMNKAISEKDMTFAQDAAFQSVKLAVKSVKGLELPNGDSFSVELENGVLTDESVDNLLNIEQSNALAAVCSSLINGIANNIIDPYTGKTMEGISFGEGTGKKS